MNENTTSWGRLSQVDTQFLFFDRGKRNQVMIPDIRAHVHAKSFAQPGKYLPIFVLINNAALRASGEPRLY